MNDIEVGVSELPIEYSILPQSSAAFRGTFKVPPSLYCTTEREPFRDQALIG